MTTIFYLNHVCPANQKGDVISPTQTASIKLRSIAGKKHKSIEKFETLLKTFYEQGQKCMAKKSF